MDRDFDNPTPDELSGRRAAAEALVAEMEGRGEKPDHDGLVMGVLGTVAGAALLFAVPYVAPLCVFAWLARDAMSEDRAKKRRALKSRVAGTD